jgi:hypothetical protein
MVLLRNGLELRIASAFDQRPIQVCHAVAPASPRVVREAELGSMLGVPLVINILGCGNLLRSAGELSADFLSFFGARALLCDSGALRRPVK